MDLKRVKIEILILAENRKEFEDSLGDLFDIAHANATNMIKIEDRKFLFAQRQKGRIGSMLGVDKKLAAIEQRKSERVAKDFERKRKFLSDQEKG